MKEIIQYLLNRAIDERDLGLAETAREFPNEDTISDASADRAKEAFNLARKIITLIEEISEEE